MCSQRVSGLPARMDSRIPATGRSESAHFTTARKRDRESIQHTHEGRLTQRHAQAAGPGREDISVGGMQGPRGDPGVGPCGPGSGSSPATLLPPNAALALAAPAQPGIRELPPLQTQQPAKHGAVPGGPRYPTYRMPRRALDTRSSHLACSSSKSPIDFEPKIAVEYDCVSPSLPSSALVGN